MVELSRKGKSFQAIPLCDETFEYMKKATACPDIMAYPLPAFEYRRCTEHGNADAISRFSNTRDFNCDDVDVMEPLCCGTCRKCRKRDNDISQKQRLGHKQEEDISRQTNLFITTD
ncbi:hypothetical protein CHS0354_012165 [Potamilus streckersoni]|uniref:Uncharacterized protein n=1 Tax=Potamilus streckersoni TaxID=2493646 RepID=A0AAE0VT22_9BIVA|nr:hypothetical protein CHS0354_012165 [Potamilus streckersoni]